MQNGVAHEDRDDLAGRNSGSQRGLRRVVDQLLQSAVIDGATSDPGAQMAGVNGFNLH